MQRGRPAKAEKDRRTNILRVCLTERERKALNGAAKAAGKDASAWARECLMNAAKKEEPGG